jgi:Ca-activated chloride channel family protein
VIQVGIKNGWSGGNSPSFAYRRRRDSAPRGVPPAAGPFYAKTGTSGELSGPHLDDRGNQTFVKSIEQTAVHYGDTTLTFLANLREADRSSP